MAFREYPTLNIYTHLDFEQKIDTAEKMGEIISIGRIENAS
jgi:hypothetical protein